jgi:hypothetical protein
MLNKEIDIKPTYDDSRYPLELSAEQHYKLFTVLGQYSDTLGLMDVVDEDMEAIRATLIDAWKKRFDHLTT